MPLEIIIPPNLIQQLLDDLKPIKDAALAVAADVPKMARDYATIKYQDASGNLMSQRWMPNFKKPRPKGNPSNHPSEPLVQNDAPDEMNPERWATNRVDDDTVEVIYSPPEHHQYLVEKSAFRGGRPWITVDEINPNLTKDIADKMASAAEDEV